MSNSQLEPVLHTMKKSDQEWMVFYRIRDENPKGLGAFVLDVDGSWIFFFDDNLRGGWPAYVLAELAAVAARFQPSAGPRDV